MKSVVLSDARKDYLPRIQSASADVLKAAENAVSKYFALAGIVREALSKGIDPLDASKAMVAGGLLGQRASEVMRVASLPRDVWRKLQDERGWKRAVSEARVFAGVARRARKPKALAVKAVSRRDVYVIASELCDALEAERAAGVKVPLTFSSKLVLLTVAFRD